MSRVLVGPSQTRLCPQVHVTAMVRAIRVAAGALRTESAMIENMGTDRRANMSVSYTQETSKWAWLG